MALPYFRIYIGDLKKDTDHMPPAVFGAYMRLLMFAMHESPTRGDVARTLPQLCRLFGTANNDEAEALLREIVDPQFNVVDYSAEGQAHRIINRRMVKETHISKERSRAGKEGAEVTAGRKPRKKKKDIAEDLPDDLPRQNGEAAESGQNSGFAGASSSANDSAKKRQNCNTDNSDNDSSYSEGIGGAGGKGTDPDAAYLVPQLRQVLARVRPAYEWEDYRDAQAARLIGQSIAKSAKIDAYSTESIGRIKEAFEAILLFCGDHNLYKGFTLAQIDKYYPGILENMRDKVRKDQQQAGGGQAVVGNNIATAQGAAEIIKNKHKQGAL